MDWDLGKECLISIWCCVVSEYLVVRSLRFCSVYSCVWWVFCGLWGISVFFVCWVVVWDGFFFWSEWKVCFCGLLVCSRRGVKFLVVVWVFLWSFWDCCLVDCRLGLLRFNWSWLWVGFLMIFCFCELYDDGWESVGWWCWDFGVWCWCCVFLVFVSFGWIVCWCFLDLFWMWCEGCW